MRFLHPQWLYWLALTPVLLLWLIWVLKKSNDKLKNFSNQKLWKNIIPEYSQHQRKKKIFILTFAYIFLILALARPQWGKKEQTVQVKGMDILFVFDLSNSMETEDVVPNRLKKAKHAIRSMVESLRGDRMGLISFAGGAYPSCPLTTDADYFLETMEIQSPRLFTHQGTDIGLALEVAVQAMSRGAEDLSGNQNTAGPVSKLIVLVTDGEDLEEAALDGAKKVKESGIGLFVIGIGSEKGGPVPVRDQEGILRGYKKDRSGQGVVSKLNPEILKKIADAASGRYWTLSESESEVDEIISEMRSMQRNDMGERKWVTYEERFQYPLALGLALLFFEIFTPARRILTSIFLVFTLFGISPQTARAGVGSYIQNERGIKKMEEGDFKGAKKIFEKAQKNNPDVPELQFNESLSAIQSGEIDAAESGFFDTARESLKTQRPDLAGRSFYNLGSLFEKKNEYEKSIESFVNAIAAAQQAQDPILEKNARARLQKVIQQQQKQEEQQKSAQNDKDKKNQDGEGQNNPGQDQGDQNKKDKKFSQNKKWKPEFKSGKLSKEDAERVLSELSDKEKDLQMKVNKNQSGQPSGGKDW